MLLTGYICLQVAALIFQGSYGTSHDFLHESLIRLLAIGLASAAVSNFVQKVVWCRRCVAVADISHWLDHNLSPAPVSGAYA